MNYRQDRANQRFGFQTSINFHKAVFDWCLEDEPRKIIDYNIHQIIGKHKNKRNSIKLSQEEKNYIKKVGLIKIRNDAEEYISKRIKIPHSTDKVDYPENHPLYPARLATGLCCRKCMAEVLNIKEWTFLNDDKEENMVCILVKWIQKQNK